MTEELLKTYCQKFLTDKGFTFSNFKSKYEEEFLPIIQKRMLIEVDRERSIDMPMNKRILYSKDGKSEILFPLELDNLDYIRRIIEILNDGIKIYVEILKVKHPDPGRKDPNGDIFYYLKWLVKNIDILIKNYSIQRDIIEPPIQNLLNVRNSLSHINSEVEQSEQGNIPTDSIKSVENSFDNSFKLLLFFSGAFPTYSAEHVQKNLVELKKQFIAHEKWKEIRKNQLETIHTAKQIEKNQPQKSFPIYEIPAKKIVPNETEIIDKKPPKYIPPHKKAEEAERIAKEEAEKLAKEKAEADRIAREKAEAERIAKEEADRIAREKAEADRIAREKAEADRIARDLQNNLDVESDRFYLNDRATAFKNTSFKKNSFSGNDQYAKKLSRQNEWKASEQVREAERLAEIEKKKN